MFVFDILRTKGTGVIAVDAGEPITAALKQLADHKIGALVVRGPQGRVVGILSERDLVRALHQHGAAALEQTVADYMTTPVMTCSPKDAISSLMGMMTALRFRHVPVLEGETLVGIISIGDVLKSHIEEAETEVEQMRRYITS